LNSRRGLTLILLDLIAQLIEHIGTQIPLFGSIMNTMGNFKIELPSRRIRLLGLFLILFIILALIVLNIISWVMYAMVARSLDNALGENILGKGRMITDLINIQYIDIEAFTDNLETEEEYYSLVSDLENWSRTSGLSNLIIVDNAGSTILDSNREFSRNEENLFWVLDTAALNIALNGRESLATTHKVGKYNLKWAFHPLKNETGDLSGFLITVAPADFLNDLNVIRFNLIWINIICALLILITGIGLLIVSRAILRTEETIYQQERYSLMGQLAAEVAHEVRNPLSIISASVQNIDEKHRETLKDDEVWQYIPEEIGRINGIIEEFLALSRQPADEFEVINIKDILENILLMIGPKLRGRKITSETNWPEGVPEKINGDIRRIKQAFINIFMNSMEAMTDDGNISVLAEAGGNELTIIIKDTGPGIPAEISKKIFTPFFTGRKGGTGLGLTVAARIISEHNGSIDISSPGRQGAQIRITFPAVEI
jgi:signal transduction histidine kinase